MKRVHGHTNQSKSRADAVARLDKPFTPISPAQVFERNGKQYHIIKNKGHVLMRDQFLRGQKSWNQVFEILVAGGSSLYGTLKELELPSIGGTGSHADIIWAALDSVPQGATPVIEISMPREGNAEEPEAGS